MRPVSKPSNPNGTTPIEQEEPPLADNIKLDFAIASYPHTAALLSGEVPITGVTPNCIQVIPQIGAFRRMVRQVEFEVCEIAQTTYIIACAYEAPFAAALIERMAGRTVQPAGVSMIGHCSTSASSTSRFAPSRLRT